jgi:hypothetical protein
MYIYLIYFSQKNNADNLQKKQNCYADNKLQNYRGKDRTIVNYIDLYVQYVAQVAGST